MRGADITVREGDYVAIVGRSGSGKSTLLAMLGALTAPTGGQLLFDGEDVWTLSEAQRADLRCRDLGFVFQAPSLLSNLTAVDNVAVPALIGHTMEARAAYDRAHELLACMGLVDRADAYPAELSGGEQRRVAIARALINSPRLLLADEPTSDLDEDVEADVIGLLEALHKRDRFGFILVTHGLGLAKHAGRTYEMRRGELAAMDPPRAAARVEDRPRRFGPAEIGVHPGWTAPPAAAQASVRLGGDLWRGVQAFLLGAGAIFAGLLLVDFGAATYQQMQMREQAARLAALSQLALVSLQGEIQSVSELGDGRYALSVSVRNVADDRPIYVMTPDMRAYVQVGQVWREIPMAPADSGAGGVVRIDGTHIYLYTFDARVRDFAQLIPNYMHMRFSGTMLVSPSSTPKDDVFERKDNYYIHLRPPGITDEAILRQTRFPGRPPLWIPMPPH